MALSSASEVALDRVGVWSVPEARDAPFESRSPSTTVNRRDRIIVPPRPSRALLDEIEDGVTPCVVDGWDLDPDDPRAPPLNIWARMSKPQRDLVDRWLMAEFNTREEEMPQGEPHCTVVMMIYAVLTAFFAQRNVLAYVGVDIMTHFPNGDLAAPDVMVVLNPKGVPMGSRHVGVDGLPDVCFEVYYHGNEKKDTNRNVSLFARHGIKEYFVYEVDHRHITGYRLVPGTKTYEGVVPDVAGRFRSDVLGLWLRESDGHIEFDDGENVIQTGVDATKTATQRAQEEASLRTVAEQRAEREATRAEQEAKRAEQEASKRTAAEQRASEAEQGRLEAERRVRELERRLAAATSNTNSSTEPG